MSAGRRYSISKAESFANQIINDAESRKKLYLDEAHDIAEKEIKLYEQTIKEEHGRKQYDLTKEKREFDESKVTEMEKVKKEYETSSKKTVEFLIENITTVRVKLQRNIVADFEGLKVNR